jgi:hypothetical protein
VGRARDRDDDDADEGDADAGKEAARRLPLSDETQQRGDLFAAGRERLRGVHEQGP